VRSLNPDEWQPSCCISLCISLHNCALRPAAHGREWENCLWYIMEIEENELENEWSGNRALCLTFVDGSVCRNISAESAKTLRSDIIYRTYDENSGGSETDRPWCFWMQMIIPWTVYWLWKMTIWILSNMIAHLMTVSMSLRWASMEGQQC